MTVFGVIYPSLQYFIIRFFARKVAKVSSSKSNHVSENKLNNLNKPLNQIKLYFKNKCVENKFKYDLKFCRIRELIIDSAISSNHINQSL